MLTQRRMGSAISPKRAALVFGETVWSDLPAIENVLVQVPTCVFVPRGSDLKVGDKFTFQDRTYFITSAAKWDYDHGNGQDLGYMEFEIGTERPPSSAG